MMGAFVGSEIIRRARAAIGSDMILISRFNIQEERHGKAGVTIKQAAEELAPAFEAAELLARSHGGGGNEPDMRGGWKDRVGCLRRNKAVRGSRSWLCREAPEFAPAAFRRARFAGG